jgi:putative FmdB family regulatory protein
MRGEELGVRQVGKAPVFGTGIRRFESCTPSQPTPSAVFLLHSLPVPAKRGVKVSAKGLFRFEHDIFPEKEYLRFMPIYEYKHNDDASCSLGFVFEVEHPISDNALQTCPQCGAPVHRLISLVNVNTPKTNSELKGMGFAKLVKRDDGIYENVTALNKESKVWDANKPETFPDIKSRISD